MNPPASSASPTTGIDPLIFLIAFGFVTLVFCSLLWECYRCLSSTLAASSDPFEAEPVGVRVRVPARSKSVPIEQIMPSFVVQIGSNNENHEVESKSGGGRGGSGSSGGKCCAICLEEFKDGELCRMFPKCNHEFHGPCVNDWLLRQNLTCPLCRNSIEDLVLAIV